MKYIVQKEFSFAGDRYLAGDLFDPLTYPFTCTTNKIEALVKSRKIKEDFKLSGRDRARNEEEAIQHENAHDAGAESVTEASDESDETPISKPVRRR